LVAAMRKMRPSDVTSLLWALRSGSVSTLFKSKTAVTFHSIKMQHLEDVLTGNSSYCYTTLARPQIKDSLHLNPLKSILKEDYKFVPIITAYYLCFSFSLMHMYDNLLHIWEYILLKKQAHCIGYCLF